MTEHTSGPWKLHNFDNEVEVRSTGLPSLTIVRRKNLYGTLTSRQMADMRLIARAPNLAAQNEALLKVLKLLVFEVSGPDGPSLTTGEQMALEQARAAIAAAEGEQE